MSRIVLFAIVILLSACSSDPSASKKGGTLLKEAMIQTEDYELLLAEDEKALLILFPCFPCDAENTKNEFDIVDIARDNGISLLMMEFNQHLWLSGEEEQELEATLTEAVSNRVTTDNIYIGGFSSGGNVALLLSDYLMATGSPLRPNGVFIADSPVDLLALYENAKENVRKDFALPAVQEAEWIIEMFDREFGVGDSALKVYEDRSPYLDTKKSIENLSELEGLDIRLYTEPDTTWWKMNRRADYEDMNAYYIEQLSRVLGEHYGSEHVDFITTDNRGYRSNGDRHPHSWAIVDENELVDWILAE